MDKQSIGIGLIGVVIVALVGIFLTRSTNTLKPNNALSPQQEPEELKLGNNSGTLGAENSQRTGSGEVTGEHSRETTMQYSKPPAMQIDSSKSYSATLTTTKGPITIEFFAEKNPITVNNFVSLARDGFYDGTIFHRTIKGFMIQGGDPEGTGRGGPGYTFDDEPFEGEYTRGIVAMANAGPNTNGSQFFIMHQDYALPPNYVIFGTVTDGMDVVDMIATAPTNPGGEGSTPVSPVAIESIAIAEE